MNKIRRLQIAKLTLKIVDLQHALGLLQDEEEECVENLPDSLQETDRADQMREFVELIESAKDLLEQSNEELHQVLDTETSIA